MRITRHLNEGACEKNGIKFKCLFLCRRRRANCCRCCRRRRHRGRRRRWCALHYRARRCAIKCDDRRWRRFPQTFANCVLRLPLLQPLVQQIGLHSAKRRRPRQRSYLQAENRDRCAQTIESSVRCVRIFAERSRACALIVVFVAV